MVARIHQVTAGLEVVAESDRPPLDADLDAQVEALWAAEVRRRGNELFNGRIFSIDKHAPSRIIGTFVEYRCYIAQRRRPDLFDQLFVQPLAVSGLIESPDGFIFGRRATDLTIDAGRWELVPSGSLDPRTCLHSGAVDYLRQFYHELAEEIAIEKAETTAAIAFALIEDMAAHVFDLAIAVRTDLSAKQVSESFLQTGREYSELKFLPPLEIRNFIDEQCDNIVPTTIAILEYRGLIDHYPIG